MHYDHIWLHLLKDLNLNFYDHIWNLFRLPGMQVAQASCHKQINKQSSNNHCYKQSFKKKNHLYFFLLQKKI
jgi:hypothetical protein